MDQLGLIDEAAIAQEQFALIANWMEGNHPEYASIIDDVDALTKEHDKIELFFVNRQIDISEDNLRSHCTDLKDWLRKTEDEIEATTGHPLNPNLPKKPCGCQKKGGKGQSKGNTCCCNERQWLLWLVTASIFLILINLKQYIVAAIFTIAAIVIARPKFIQDVL